MTDTQFANHTEAIAAHRIVMRAYDHIVNQSAMLKQYNHAAWLGATGSDLLQARYILVHAAEHITAENRANNHRAA